ncbi:MAG TPA: hypothetical protein VK400_20915 [Pyrinomonadaceae bacterium]|nr:hypothetical protein [Pyrinomonadaceae bacterium]
MTFHNDEKISQAIVTLLESNIGYSVDFYGKILCIRQLDDLTFAVSHKKYDPETTRHVFDFERIFTDAKEATEFFLQKRLEYELGADFEIEKQPN